MSSTKLQAHHQPCAFACDTTSANNAWNVQSDVRVLSWHVPSEFSHRNSPKTPNDFIFPQFNTLTNALARCPHCRKVSSVGVDFARNRSNVYMAFGFIFLAVGIAVAWTTYSYAIVSFIWNLSRTFFKFSIFLRITRDFSSPTLECS